MTTVIRAASAADFLALIPRLAGFVPVDSIVLVPFAGNRAAGAMRLDLPASTDPTEIDRIAATCVGLVCKVAHTDALAVVVYTDDRLVDGDTIAHDAFVNAICSRADLCGLRVTEALCVAADAWGSYLDQSLPARGRPLEEIPHGHDALADIPFDSGDQAAGAELPAIDLAEKERVAHALLLLEEAVAREATEPQAMIREFLEAASPGLDEIAASAPTIAMLGARIVGDPPLLFERCLRWRADELHPSRVATLLWCLSRPLLRDVALSQWATDLSTGEAAFDAQLEWAAGEPHTDDLVETMTALSRTMCGEGPRPDLERLQTALALCRRVAAAAPHDLRPGPLSAAAWLSWALGRSTHAAHYAQDALLIDPDHGMSGIVLSMVSHARLPEWAFAQPAPPTDPPSRLLDSRGLERRR